MPACRCWGSIVEDPSSLMPRHEPEPSGPRMPPVVAAYPNERRGMADMICQPCPLVQRAEMMTAAKIEMMV